MDKSELERLIVSEKTIWNISKMVGVSFSAVRLLLKKFGISTPKGFFSKGKRVGRPVGIAMSDEQKALLSKKFSGEGNPFFGKTHSDETRIKMSENHADFVGESNPFKRSLRDPKKKKEHNERCQAIWDKRDLSYRKKFGKKQQEGFEDISASFWSRVVRNAACRGHEMGLSIEDAWAIFLSQNKTCALTGVQLVFGNTLFETTASLDRIDCEKGYTIDNVQWVHKVINIMRNRLTVEEFIWWCGRVSCLEMSKT
jgi:hypothetical protein